MRVSNATVADTLRRYAAVLSLEGVSRFKVRAYRRAAETIENLGEEVAALVEAGHDLTELPGIGSAIDAVVGEIVRDGKLGRLERTVQRLTPAVAELATKPLLDPKVVTRVYKKLKIGSLAELQRSLDAGQIRAALGARVDHHIRLGLDERPRHLLYSVTAVAQNIERFLRALPSVSRVSAAGSLRRQRDTVGDLNFLVAAPSATRLFKQFSRFGAALASEPRGTSERLYRLSSGLTVALRHAPAAEWGLSLIQATGSASHLAELEEHAAQRSMSCTSAALSARGADVGEEGSVYETLGLAFIAPELREGRGEVAAAAAAALPKLIELSDIRGDLHMHTTASDGRNSIAEMAAAAQERGYEYIAITDHSQSLRITNGLTETRLRQHIREIDRLNERLAGFRIFKSAEVDILADGKLDYSNAVLKELDFTICSIHSRFGLNKQAQTERVLRAMDNPYFTILGHATGRLLLKREGYELDIERILEHARARGCYCEINSSADRLDLSDEHAKLARDRAIKIAIDTDAHSIDELDFMSAGINQARRGWLEADDVINTLRLPELQQLWSACRR
jgi:DNA polymerase (family 10)